MFKMTGEMLVHCCWEHVAVQYLHVYSDSMAQSPAVCLRFCALSAKGLMASHIFWWIMLPPPRTPHDVQCGSEIWRKRSFLDVMNDSSHL